VADQRIKGQEVEVLLIVNGQVQQTITDVRSFEVTPKFDKLEEGYLGETTDRYDEMFKGVRGAMELHFENQDIFNLVQSVLDRARRRTPGTIVNIKATLRFPNGQRPRVIIQDAFFGDMPINFGSRADYGTLKLDFESSNFQKI
jgi:hypothetical protein